jgi:hypothetical protein
MNYLCRHEAIASLPLIYQEQQIIAFLEEYTPSINLFIYPYFAEEKEEFLSFLREQTNEQLMPTLELFFEQGILSIFPEFFPSLSPPSSSELTRLLTSLLNHNKSREQLLLNFSFLQSGLPSALIHGLFSLENSYTIHLIESEEEKNFTSKMVLDFVTTLLLLCPLIFLWEEESKQTLRENFLSKAVMDLNRRFVFIPTALFKKVVEVDIPLSENSSTSSLAKLATLLREEARFPLLKDKLAGALSSGESWFASQFTNPALDKRILKELWESYKEWVE